MWKSFEAENKELKAQLELYKDNEEYLNKKIERLYGEIACLNNITDTLKNYVKFLEKELEIKQ